MTDWLARARPWLNALLILLLMLPLARLAWQVLVPVRPAQPAPASVATSPVPRPVTPALDVAAIRQAQLFGSPAGVAANGEIPESTLQLKLKGVIAAGDNPHAVAIFDGGDPQTRAARVGMNIMPNVVVKAVYKDKVIVSNNGRDERLMLQAPPPISLNSGPGTPGAGASAGAAPIVGSPAVSYGSPGGPPASARTYMNQASPGYSGGTPPQYQQQAPTYPGYNGSVITPGGMGGPPPGQAPNWQTQ